MDVDGFIHDHTLVDYSTKEYNWDIIMYLFLCVCVFFKGTVTGFRNWLKCLMSSKSARSSFTFFNIGAKCSLRLIDKPRRHPQTGQ